MSCKDCLPDSKRPVVEKSGGRCATHWRTEKARRKKAAHENRVQKVYGLADGDYDRLYAYQGGVCAICGRARGVARRLAVDHDHATGFVRGLLCSTDNKILGHLRDDPELAQRIVNYLNSPPAYAAIGLRKAEDG